MQYTYFPFHYPSSRNLCTWPKLGEDWQMHFWEKDTADLFFKCSKCICRKMEVFNTAQTVIWTNIQNILNNLWNMHQVFFKGVNVRSSRQSSFVPEQPPDFLWDIFCCCDAGLRWWEVWSAWIQTISFDVWVSAQRLNTNFSDCGRSLKSQNRKTVRKKNIGPQLKVAFFVSFGFWARSNISGDEL